MELIRQGYNECLLTTVAMLARTTVPRLKREFKKELGICYGDYLWGRWWKFQPGKGRKEIQAWLCAKAGLDLETVIRWWTRDRFATVPGNDPVIPDLSGEGMVIVEWNEQKMGHAMGYKDGLIYDGNAPEPMTVSAWVEQRLPYYGGKTIKKMTAFPKGTS